MKPGLDAGADEIESWFDENGLPYFVAGRANAIESWLSNRRIIVAAAVLIVVAVLAGYGVGRLSGSGSVGFLIGVLLLLSSLAVYAGGLLRMAIVLRWALRRTFTSLNLLFPLVTRALPLLLLFITFLFINTEVWQVASAMRRGILWSTVLFFGVIALVFLLVRLPEEVRRVEHDADGPAELPRLARVNLVLVMLFNQALQVLLLSLTVFAFFVLFGCLAISDSVIEAWVGRAPDAIVLFDRTLTTRPSDQLFQVSVFLSAFSGLYFTVYAVTDQTYREQFFASLADELETAIGVHARYRSMLG